MPDRRVRIRLALGALGIAALAVVTAFPPRPRLVWNVSASAPVGLYRVAPGAPVARGDMVVARLPEPWRGLAAHRHYLPANVPLVKRVAAVPGDTICAAGEAVFVTGRHVASRRFSDGRDRPLPWWTGCRTLRNGELFLLMAGSADSFDGRYFGATDARDIIGQARLIWAKPAKAPTMASRRWIAGGGALRVAIIALALCAASPARADSLAQWRPLVAEASARFGIPVTWIERVMRAESGGRTMLNGRPITSRAGAMGLMQLMPGTWAAMRARLRLGADPHDPRDNIMAGTAYLRLMHDRFGYPGLFGAYNAGPGRYAEHLATGRPLPGETRAYLASVAGRASSPSVAVAEGPAQGIFFALRGSSDPEGSNRKALTPLFVQLGAGTR